MQTMNAFDLINMCGSMALNRMFLTLDERRVKRYTQLISSLPATDILSRLNTILQNLDCDVRTFEDTYKSKFSFMSSKGEINGGAQVYTLTDSLSIVEFKRGKGDVFEYHNFYDRLYKQLGDIVGDRVLPGSNA